MDFVEITKDGIAGVAKVPVTALSHWESYGWRKVDSASPDEEPMLASVSTPPAAISTRPSRRAHIASGITEE